MASPRQNVRSWCSGLMRSVGLTWAVFVLSVTSWHGTGSHSNWIWAMELKITYSLSVKRWLSGLSSQSTQKKGAGRLKEARCPSCQKRSPSWQWTYPEGVTPNSRVGFRASIWFFPGKREAIEMAVGSHNSICCIFSRTTSIWLHFPLEVAPTPTGKSQLCSYWRGVQCGWWLLCDHTWCYVWHSCNTVLPNTLLNWAMFFCHL